MQPCAFEMKFSLISYFCLSFATTTLGVWFWRKASFVSRLRRTGNKSVATMLQPKEAQHKTELGLARAKITEIADQI